MRRALVYIACGVVFGMAGLVLAQQALGPKQPRPTGIKTLMDQALNETVNGKPGRIVLVELKEAPQAASKPHRHPGPVIGYVLEGELEVQVDNGPVKRYQRGDVWFEPARALHRVNRNPSKTKPARFLAFMLLTQDDHQLVLPPH